MAGSAKTIDEYISACDGEVKDRMIALRALIHGCHPDITEKIAWGIPTFVLKGKDTFRLAWRCARPNAIVTVVALYDEAQSLPLPEMYGKNLTFKTGGVDGCDCN